MWVESVLGGSPVLISYEKACKKDNSTWEYTRGANIAQKIAGILLLFRNSWPSSVQHQRLALAHLSPG